MIELNKKDKENIMKEIKIGLVGAGRIACNAHLPAYQKAIGVKVAAICDIDIEKAKAAAKKFGIENCYSSMTEMLKNKDLDAVDICVWNKDHVPLSLEAAKSGKHVICEKPAAMSVSELYELKKVINENGLTYLLAVPNRFKSETECLKELIDNGKIGNIYYAKTSYLRRRGAPNGWFTDKSISGGGPLMDLAPHAIDGAWYIMGCPKPKRVSAMCHKSIGKYTEKGVEKYSAAPSPNGDRIYDCEDSVAGVIYFENGAHMFFDTSWALNAPDRRDVYVYGNLGGALLSPPTLYTDNSGYATNEEIVITEKKNAYLGEIQHFIDCVRSGITETRFGIDDAITMQTMLDAIRESSEKGCEISIEKIGD
jgi:predicted dehydrogenase